MQAVLSPLYNLQGKKKTENYRNRQNNTLRRVSLLLTFASKLQAICKSFTTLSTSLPVYPQCEERKIYVVFKVNLDKFL